MDYLRQPDAIYAQSFAEISRIEPLQAMPDAVRPLATRIVHACAMPDILDDLRYSDTLIAAAEAAFAAGADIYCDVDTLRYGVMQRLLPTGCQLHCNVSSPETGAFAKANSMTRSAAQIDLWGERLKGQIMAIGNAPTTLFRLLELIDQGLPKPAVIVAFPVGFVGAAESKAELVRDARGVPFVTLLGRRGGTAMAQAAINALAGGLNT
jgi:precorrin-8X/cobalt-precorrin-8 methylmutase